MNENIRPIDIRALQFRDEFIKLCNKYRCNISASCRDDGNMELEICDIDNDYSYYTMKDTYDNYNLYEENNNYEIDNMYTFDCVMDGIIKASFDRESGEMGGLNNIKVSCGVITNDWAKSTLKISRITL